MSRRVALAFSFVLTIVTGFALASIGTQAGWFSAAASTPDVEAIAPTEAPTSGASADATAATPDPVVITDYLYVDKPIYRTTTPANAPAPSSSPSGQSPTVAPPTPSAAGLSGATAAPTTQEASAPRAATAKSPSQAPSTSSSRRGDDDDHEDDDDDHDEHEDEHEDEHDDD